MGRSKQAERGSNKGGKAGPPPTAGGLEPKRHSTPEERRAAVEAFERSGLTQAAFARQWGVSHVTLGKWLAARIAEPTVQRQNGSALGTADAVDREVIPPAQALLHDGHRIVPGVPEHVRDRSR